MAVHFPQPSTASFWGIKKKLKNTLSRFIVWQSLRFFSFKLRCEMSVMQTVVDLSKVCVTVSFSPFETEKNKKLKCKCMSRVTASVCHHKLFSRMNCRRCRIRSGHHLKLSCRAEILLSRRQVHCEKHWLVRARALPGFRDTWRPLVPPGVLLLVLFSYGCNQTSHRLFNFCDPKCTAVTSCLKYFKLKQNSGLKVFSSAWVETAIKLVFSCCYK